MLQIVSVTGPISLPNPATTLLVVTCTVRVALLMLAPETGWNLPVLITLARKKAPTMVPLTMMRKQNTPTTMRYLFLDHRRAHNKRDVIRCGTCSGKGFVDLTSVHEVAGIENGDGDTSWCLNRSGFVTSVVLETSDGS